jgi:SSS family solute:Na+ symporter
MHHPAYAAIAGKVTHVLSGIENPTIRNQQTVPVVLAYLLPMGLRGALCATVLAAFISNQGSGLHSWGSILLQDVIMPFRKTAFDPKRHILYLRLSIAAVAIIVFAISLLYRQTQAIFMFFALTAGMFIGGAGAMILGGLYWKRGSTAGAWAAMLTGLIISLTGFVCEQVWASKFGRSFPINGQYIYAFAMVSSSVMYVIFSLIENHTFDLDKLLHRGKYAIQEATPQDTSTEGIPGWLVKMGLSNEFSRFDKFIFYWTIGYTTVWIGQWIVVNALNLVYHFNDQWWLFYWRCVLWFTFVLGIIIAIWFTIGGIREIRQMFILLKTAVRNHEDNGMVIESKSSSDTEPAAETVVNKAE